MVLQSFAILPVCILRYVCGPRSMWCYGQLQLLAPYYGQFSFYPDDLGQNNKDMQCSPYSKRVLQAVYQYHQLQIDIAFLRSYVTIHVQWCINGKRMSMSMSNTHMDKNFQMKTFHKLESVNDITLSFHDIIWSMYFNSTKWNMINWGSRGDCQSTKYGFSDADVTSIGSPSG